MHHVSKINGITPQHLAVTWPVGLKHLIQAQSDVNAKDHHGRRPIHLAIALEAYESIDLLLEADCALAPYIEGETVLHLALKSNSLSSNLRRGAILEAIAKAYINRHKRLRELARSVLSLEQAQRLRVAEGFLCESTTVLIREEISACGVHVPPELDLGAESVYEVADLHSDCRMAPETASILWEGGFKDIWSPNEQGLSPMLQNWHCANFEMIQWFIDKGVSPDQQHRDGRFGALHLYAKRVNYPGAYFGGRVENVPTSPLLIPHLHNLEANRDDCRCLCSPAGCSPVTVVVKNYQEYYAGHETFEIFSSWVKKTSMLTNNEALRNTYARDMTQILVFEFLSSRCPDLYHTCCSMDQLGGIELNLRLEKRRKSRFYREWRSPKITSTPDHIFSGPHRGNGAKPLPLTECKELSNRIMGIYDEWRANHHDPIIFLPWDFMKDPIVRSRNEKLVEDFLTPIPC